MYRILIVPDAQDELDRVPAFYRRQVEQAIKTQLRHDPEKTTKNRKCLRSAADGFQYEPPLWEFRVGEWRIFYDVEDRNVIIRAFRMKPPGKKTEDIL